MVGDDLAKSYGGLSYDTKAFILYINSRVEKKNFSNWAELHYKPYEKIKVALENQNMEL